MTDQNQAVPAVIKLSLSVEDVNFVLYALGELPTKTGAFPLTMKIRAQAEPQVPEPAAPVEEPKAA